VARALELDPALGQHGPRLVLLTPGSLMPGIGVHRHASQVRKVILHVATEPSILWIDVQARADVLNFYNFFHRSLTNHCLLKCVDGSLINVVRKIN